MVMNKYPEGRLHKEYYRNGEQHRGGADVSFSDIVKIFGFRSIDIGKWVSKQEQQIAANLFFDALCDLMDILDVPEQVISLRGTLSLSFGIGGQKYASAHYNSAKRQLGLAKNAGGGALAHEWFHGFDHFICNKMFTHTSANMFASEVWLNDLTPMVKHPLNACLGQAFSAMLLDSSGQNPSALMSSSIKLDTQNSIFYYARPQEIGARAFERMIQEHRIKNAFLAQGTMQSKEAKLGLYPSGEALGVITEHLMKYFNLLGRALKHSV